MPFDLGQPFTCEQESQALSLELCSQAIPEGLASPLLWWAEALLGQVCYCLPTSMPFVFKMEQLHAPPLIALDNVCQGRPCKKYFHFLMTKNVEKAPHRRTNIK